MEQQHYGAGDNVGGNKKIVNRMVLSIFSFFHNKVDTITPQLLPIASTERYTSIFELGYNEYMTGFFKFRGQDKENQEFSNSFKDKSDIILKSLNITRLISNEQSLVFDNYNEQFNLQVEKDILEMGILTGSLFTLAVGLPNAEQLLKENCKNLFNDVKINFELLLLNYHLYKTRKSLSIFEKDAPINFNDLREFMATLKGEIRKELKWKDNEPV